MNKLIKGQDLVMAKWRWGRSQWRTSGNLRDPRAMGTGNPRDPRAAPLASPQAPQAPLGHGMARPWTSGARGKPSGAALGPLGFPVPMALGSLGFPDLRHWLRAQRHLAMAWPGHGQVLARPGNTFVETMVK